jgi:ATP-dependent Zn protease
MQTKLNHCLEVPLRNGNLTWSAAAQLHHRSSDFTNAVERMIAGFERKNSILNPKELQVIAYYKIGPGLTAASLPGADPVQ